MEKVGQVLKGSLGRQSSPRGAPTRSGDGDDVLVSQLFVRMNSIYGPLWSSRFADARLLRAAKAEWGAALSGRDGETIMRAVTVCQQQYDMPPTLPQFIRLCRPLCDAHRMFKALPRPAPDRAVASAGIARLRGLLA